MLAPAVVVGNTVVVAAAADRPLPAVTLAEVLATSDVPGGVVNLLTGALRRHRADPGLAHGRQRARPHRGLGRATPTALEEAAAENLKRVRRPVAEDWTLDPGTRPDVVAAGDQDGLAPDRPVSDETVSEDHPGPGRLLVDGRDVALLERAVTARTRSKGLLGRTGLDGALWLAPARQVHTFRMRFAIDVAHVDKRGAVLLVRTMEPGRLGPWSWRSRGVLEAEAGAFARWGLAPGSTVDVTSRGSAGGGPARG